MLRHITEWCSRAYRHARTYERERDDGMSVGSCEAVREAGCKSEPTIAHREGKVVGGAKREMSVMSCGVGHKALPPSTLTW